MSDVDELLRLLDGLCAKDLMPSQLSVGAASVRLGRVLDAGSPAEEETESLQEVEARIKREMDEQWATQYASAQGGVPGMPD